MNMIHAECCCLFRVNMSAGYKWTLSLMGAPIIMYTCTNALQIPSSCVIMNVCTVARVFARVFIWIHRQQRSDLLTDDNNRHCVDPSTEKSLTRSIQFEWMAITVPQGEQNQMHLLSMTNAWIFCLKVVAFMPIHLISKHYIFANFLRMSNQFSPLTVIYLHYWTQIKYKHRRVKTIHQTTTLPFVDVRIHAFLPRAHTYTHQSATISATNW